MNGIRAMIPVPSNIPAIHRLNFVILNIGLFSSIRYYYYPQHHSLELKKLYNKITILLTDQIQLDNKKIIRLVKGGFEYALKGERKMEMFMQPSDYPII
jgi:hypothetical protein